MNNINHLYCASIVAAFFGVIFLCGAAAEAPFKTDELKRFLADSPPFLEWVRTNHQERVLQRVMEKPKAIEEFPEAVRLLRKCGWEPERFAYILNHVVVASKRLGMGRDSGQLLARLEQTKVAVEKDGTQSDQEKARTLALVAEAQREVAKTDRSFAALPAEEVRLMWLYRAELRKALESRLPMTERVLPNPARKQ